MVGFELNIDSDAYATSTGNSAASSIASTPIHTSKMPTRTLSNAADRGLPGSPPGVRGSNHASISARSSAHLRRESDNPSHYRGSFMRRQSSDPLPEGSNGGGGGGGGGGVSENQMALMSRLEQLARSDPRTFEGSVGDHTFTSGKGGHGHAPPPALPFQSPAARELARKAAQKGISHTPLRLSDGGREFHPEPDSPGFNGTPGPSPSVTPVGFATPTLSSTSTSSTPTPTPRSPFTAHSPRTSYNAARDQHQRKGSSSSSSNLLPTFRGNHRAGMRGSMSSVDGNMSSAYMDNDEADSDLEDEQRMLQYDLSSPSFDLNHAASSSSSNNNRRASGREMLRVPLDLDTLSLPPATGAQCHVRSVVPQRIKDPVSGAPSDGTGKQQQASSSSIFAPKPVAAHALPESQRSELSRLIHAASASEGMGIEGFDTGRERRSSSLNGSRTGSAFNETRSRGGSATTNNSNNTNNGNEHEVGRKDSSAMAGEDREDEDQDQDQASKQDGSSHSSYRPRTRTSSTAHHQHQHHNKRRHRKRATSSAATDEAGAKSSSGSSPLKKRLSKPRSLRNLIMWSVSIAVTLILIYLLFFTTIAPQDVPNLPVASGSGYRATSSGTTATTAAGGKNSKIKVPKIKTQPPTTTSSPSSHA